MCYLHTVEYYSAVKKNRVLTQVTAWMNFENITLSERNQTQKATYCRILFIGNVRKRQTYRDTKQISGDSGLGTEGMKGHCLMGARLLLGVMRMF